MLTIRLIDNVVYRDFIVQCRVETYRECGLELPATTLEPLPYGVYIGAFDGDEIVGMIEGFAYRDAFGSYEESLYHNSAIDLNWFCPFGEMAHARTVYLSRQYRKAFNFFALYIAAGRYFHELGYRYTTLGTVTQGNEYLNSLYRKIGAEYSYTPDSASNFTIYVIDILKMITHSMAPRVRFEPELLKA